MTPKDLKRLFRVSPRLRRLRKNTRAKRAVCLRLSIKTWHYYRNTLTASDIWAIVNQVTHNYKGLPLIDLQKCPTYAMLTRRKEQP